MSARCKHQRLRRNIHEIELIHPRECHHQHAAWEWDRWEDTQGRHQFPSQEEAEYSATLAFAIAVLVSWWAVREGHARLHVPRMPPLEACGRRQHWLDIDPRAMRSWAMTPLAITLGLPPLHPEERARLPTLVRVADVLADDKLPPDVVYVGQGHHSHRVPRSQWASPFVQGHTCTTDDWLPLYVDFVLANLQAELPALQGKRLACDCGPDGVCEADALAGMVFDATHPDAEASLPRVTGRRHRQARGSVVRAATIMGSLQGSDALQSMSLWFPQEDVILAFRKLYPAEWFQSFQWPMLEDLLNKEPFTWTPAPTCQSEAIRGVTSKRDLGLLGLFVVLMQWGDFALPHGFIKGLPAVGYAPHYAVFPHQPVEVLHPPDEPEPAQAVCQRRSIPAHTSLCHHTGVWQVASDRRRSASSRDANKLVLCTPLQRSTSKLRQLAFRSAPGSGSRSRGSGRELEMIGRMPTATVPYHDRRPWPA